MHHAHPILELLLVCLRVCQTFDRIERSMSSDTQNVVSVNKSVRYHRIKCLLNETKIVHPVRYDGEGLKHILWVTQSSMMWFRLGRLKFLWIFPQRVVKCQVLVLCQNFS
jgi:hypothetical protein